MFLKCLILLLFLNIIDADYPYRSYGRSRSEAPCSPRSLLHGRVRLRQRMKLAEHTCYPRYTLVGNKYATCRKGEWDVPTPVCVKSGCGELMEVKNSVNITSFNGAWVNFFCFPGFKREGSSVVYCDGRNWNSSVPECVEFNNEKPATSCDFENEDICGWTQDTLHDFDWIRYNLRTPSTYFLTGPSNDHTYGKNEVGYYMYIEGTSRLPNDTARLLSPVYDSELAKNSCFVFFYHMYGRDIGGLRVYQKPDSVTLDSLRSDDEREQYLLFEMWGEQGDNWYDNVSPLKDYSEDFQIVIEGIRGKSYASDLAIDDVAILQGENCTISSKEASTPPPITVDSCAGRCFTATNTGHCGCDIICLLNNNCCPDYLAVCEYGNSTDIPDWYTGTMELPQTQKLVATKTSPIPTIVAVSTTTTPKTTTKTKITTTPTTTTRAPKITRPTTKFTTTKRTTPKPATTKLTTTKLATTSRLPRPTTIRKFTTPISTTKLSTTTRNYTRYTPKPTRTPKLNSTTISGRVNMTTTRQTTTKQTTKPTHQTESTIISRSTTANATTRTQMKKIPPTQSSEGMSGPKVVAIVIVVLVLCCGLVWVGVAARGSSRLLVMAHLRGRARGESEVRYLNSDVDDEE